MATVRYSGQVKLRVRYLDERDSYRVSVSHKGKHIETLEGISLSAFERTFLARDSVDAFDRVARASLAFASDEVESKALYTDDGYAITRRPNGPIIPR